MSRRFLPLFLLLTLLAGTAGYYPFFKLQQWAVRKEVKQRIKLGVSRSDLHAIPLTRNNLSRMRWTRANKEFELGGTMYDIVTTDTANGVVRYLCINDTEEKNLFARLDQLTQDAIDHGNTPAGRRNIRLLKLITSLVYLPVRGFQLEPRGVVTDISRDSPLLYDFDFICGIYHPPSASRLL